LQLWVAAGGRLIILGGTLGPGALNAFPDEILPFRPSTTVDVATADLPSLSLPPRRRWVRARSRSSA
jgi:hypothetical protein